MKAKAIELIQEHRYPRIGAAWQTSKLGKEASSFEDASAQRKDCL